MKWLSTCLLRSPRLPERAPAVVRDLRLHRRHVDAIGGLRIGMDVLVIHRLRLHVAAPLPRFARVVRGVERDRVVRGLDLRVDQSLLRRRERRHDAAEIAAGHPGANPPPRGAAVGGLVQTAFRPAVNQRPRVPAPLVRRGEQHVGIERIHDHVADAGVLADVEDLVPRRAAVGGLVEAAIAAGAPQRPVGRDENDLRIARIDHDAAESAASPSAPCSATTARHRRCDRCRRRSRRCAGCWLRRCRPRSRSGSSDRSPPSQSNRRPRSGRRA